MHVGSETVLIAVRLAAHRAEGLRGDAVLVVISGDVHVQRMLIFEIAFSRK